jgi:hypothetical protein
VASAYHPKAQKQQGSQIQTATLKMVFHYIITWTIPELALSGDSQ